MRFHEAFVHVILESKSNLRGFCFGAETEENLLEFLWIAGERRLDGLCPVVKLSLNSKFSRGFPILRSMLTYKQAPNAYRPLRFPPTQ